MKPQNPTFIQAPTEAHPRVNPYSIRRKANTLRFLHAIQTIFFQKVVDNSKSLLYIEHVQNKFYIMLRRIRHGKRK
jgi:hypothetical protein